MQLQWTIISCSCILNYRYLQLIAIPDLNYTRLKGDKYNVLKEVLQRKDTFYVC